jgi:hypothetical protein
MRKIMVPLWLAAVVGVASCGQPAAVFVPGQTSTQNQALIEAPELAPTRLLRRLSLSLRGHEPTVEEYAAAQLAADSGTQAEFLQRTTDEYLYSDAWRKQMFLFGQDYVGIGDYKKGTIEGGQGSLWRGSQSARLEQCNGDTLHAGKWAHFTVAVTQPSAEVREVLCNDGGARVDTVEPWWAPGTTVGRAGNGVRTYVNNDGASIDCGVTSQGEATLQDVYAPNAQCGCGPNLVYCYPADLVRANPNDPADLNLTDRNGHALQNGARRMFFEEAARYFAYVADQDLPMTELVLGTDTVGPRLLKHAYVRWARMNGANAFLDDVQWWRDSGDDWSTPTETSTLQPNLLADRGYVFDPRTDDGDPLGIPAAGVLTMLGSNGWYPRERVRAARWLEIFACRDFAAPDPSIQFPAFTGDPYDSGPCMHCHQTIDPAAIHFKRIDVEEENARHGGGYVNMGGIGNWATRKQSQVSFEAPNIPGGVFYFEPYRRWQTQFTANTFLTPVSAERVDANPDARLIDFLPPGQTLFGEESDGTIGPAGFAKLLVQSGEFDQCATKRVFERVTGRKLDVAAEAQLHRTLVEEFVSHDRHLRDLVRFIVAREEFRKGI